MTKAGLIALAIVIASTAPASASPPHARVIGIEAGSRKPESRWVIELTLTNNNFSPRWFIWSDPLDEPLDKPRQTSGLRLFEVPAASGALVPMVHLDATNEVVAVLLPPNATVTLTRLRLSCWAPLGVKTLEVLEAAQLSVGGVPLVQGWLKGRRLDASAGARGDVALRKRVFKYQRPGGGELTIQPKDPIRYSVRLDQAGHPLPTW